MYKELHLDWETRSLCDLKKRGLIIYANDPSTDIWVGVYSFDNEPAQPWFPGDPVPKEIIEHIEAGSLVIAHNAFFEIHICNEIAAKRYGWPVLKIEQCNCTMVQAYAMGLPGSLEKAAPAAGIDQKKDMVGNRLMVKMSKPKSIGENCNLCSGTGMDAFDVCECVQWHDDVENILRLTQYCKQDVEVERELYKRILKISRAEHKVWELDFVINNRGVKIDIKCLQNAIDLVALEKINLNKELKEVTENAIAATTEVGQIKKWLAVNGLETDSLAAPVIVKLLEEKNLNPKVRKVLELRQLGSKTSTAKLDKMKSLMGSDGRVRGIFQYHSATTGRWGGRGIQPQNFPRPPDTLPQHDIEDVFSILERVQ